MLKIIIPSTAAAALLLTGCVTSDRLDELAAGRCANAEQRIAQLQATADLYEADDLAERLLRWSQLAEIWCVPDAEAPISPVPVIPEPPAVDGGA